MCMGSFYGKHFFTIVYTFFIFTYFDFSLACNANALPFRSPHSSCWWWSPPPYPPLPLNAAGPGARVAARAEAREEAAAPAANLAASPGSKRPAVKRPEPRPEAPPGRRAERGARSPKGAVREARGKADVQEAEAGRFAQVLLVCIKHHDKIKRIVILVVIFVTSETCRGTIAYYFARLFK